MFQANSIKMTYEAHRAPEDMNKKLMQANVSKTQQHPIPKPLIKPMLQKFQPLSMVYTMYKFNSLEVLTRGNYPIEPKFCIDHLFVHWNQISGEEIKFLQIIATLAYINT